jgi:hypothetical protein
MFPCHLSYTPICCSHAALRLLLLDHPVLGGIPGVVPNFGYLGCYEDDPTRPAVPNLVADLPNAMTAELCQHLAIRKGYLGFFALQEGTKCYATNNLTAAVRYGTSDECTTPCDGNRVEFCGGTQANLLYKISSGR